MHLKCTYNNKTVHMKKLSTVITCLLWLLFSSKLLAQTHLGIDNEQLDSVLIKNKVSEIIKDQTYFNKGKKKGFSRQLKRYDKSNRVATWCSMTDTLRKFKLTNLASYQYSAAEKEHYHSSMVGYYFKTYMTELVFHNSKGEIDHIQYFDKKGRYSGMHKMDRPDTLNFILTKYNRRNKPVYVYHHTYGFDKKLIRSSYYNGKGKITKIIDYKCEDRGKEINPKQDTLKVCVSKAYNNDGSVITITNGFNSFGKPFRKIEQIDSFKRLIRYEYYYEKELKLQYKIHYTYKNNHLVAQYSYFNYQLNDKHRVEYIQYSEKGLILSRTDTFNQGKKTLITKYEYTYNDKGLVLSAKAFENGWMKSEAYYRYRYF